MVAVGTLSIVGGCTGSSSGLKLGKVSGKVTYADGTPVVGAVVTFVPEKSSGNAASVGKTNESGEYTIKTGEDEGAVIGKNKVHVSLYVNPDGTPVVEKADEGMDMGMAEAGQEAPGLVEGAGTGMKSSHKQAISPEYSDPKNTKLSWDVKADGTTEANFKVGKKQK